MEFPLDEIYQMFYAFHEDFALWIMIFAVICGFILSFAVGANDSANSWGTPVGAGTISFGVAVLFGAIMETTGAILLSSGVVNSVAGSKSVVNISLYTSDNVTEWDNFQQGKEYLLGERYLMLGMLSSMVASQIFQLAATYVGWPVSGTHAIISSLAGFTLVEKGWAGIVPGEVNPLCASGIYKVLWGLLLSPILALFIGLVIYYLVYSIAVSSDNPRGTKNRIIYTICVFLMSTCVGFSFSTAKRFHAPTILTTDYCLDPNKSLFGLLVGLACGLIVSIPFHFFILPKILRTMSEFHLSLDFVQKKLEKRGKEEVTMSEAVVMHKIDSDNNVTTVDIADEGCEEEYKEAQEVKNVFRPLQFVVACFAALNHGGNDVANCIGPLVTIWFIYKKPLGYDTTADEPVWMAWGGIGISLGLLMFGRRVIMTMGTKITPMTPSLGFVVVLSASLVVMLCTFLGIPVSTTHCQVMALVGGGVARGWVDTHSITGGLATVDVKVFGNIALSWVSTIPASMAISAALYSILRVAIIGPF